MTDPIELIFGLVLVLYPFWCKKDLRTKIKRVITTVGIALLCSWGVAVWLASAVHDPNVNRDVWDAMLHLQRVLSGVTIGLIIGLIVQGELFPSKKGVKEESEEKAGTQEESGVRLGKPPGFVALPVFTHSGIGAAEKIVSAEKEGPVSKGVRQVSCRGIDHLRRRIIR
jgi:hypothetical protein